MRKVLSICTVGWLFSAATPVFGYSVLTHEAVIDAAWDDALLPAIRARFPNATPDDLHRAHAFAYGGVIVQDMGYYPFGTPFFSDLAHYVRSGDFVENVVADARTLEEYAFALGTIAHYAGDTNGHSQATNRSVPLIYPKLRKKFGDVVTYADDDKSHIQTEFGFDVIQAARGRYASKAYHDFIGFEVCEDLLERAFSRTYGLELDEILDQRDLAFGSFRFSVSTLIPRATEMAWEAKKDEIAKDNPGVVRENFVYQMSRENYEKEWGTSYVHAKPGTKVLGSIVDVLPKVGPLKAQGFEPPTPEAEKLYLASFDKTLATYRQLIAEARRGELELENRNFDTGQPLRPGEYVLADQAYEKWLRSLEKADFRTVTPEIRSDIVAFYSTTAPGSDGARPAVASASGTRTSQSKASRESLQQARQILRKLEASPAPSPNEIAQRHDVTEPGAELSAK